MKRSTTFRPEADMLLQKGKWERSETMHASVHEDLPASAFYLPSLVLILKDGWCPSMVPWVLCRVRAGSNGAEVFKPQILINEFNESLPAFIYLFYFFKFIWFWERERERERDSTPEGGGEEQRGRERIPSPDAGLGEIMTWAQIKSWMLNWLSHPGAPSWPAF